VLNDIECEWLGRLLFANVTVLAPPALPEFAFAERPITNLEDKSGVPLAPLHKYQPDGIFALVPDHKAINPVGIETIPVNAAPLIAGNAPDNWLEGIVPDTDRLPVTEAPVAETETLVAPACSSLLKSSSMAVTDTVAAPERFIALLLLLLSAGLRVKVVPDALYVPVPISKLLPSSITY
jgi:hypothetical protein